MGRAASHDLAHGLIWQRGRRADLGLARSSTCYRVEKRDAGDGQGREMSWTWVGWVTHRGLKQLRQG